MLLVAALVARPFATDACSSSDEVRLLEPVPNATAVPTDVELWIAGGVEVPGRLLTLESADGVAVPFTIRRVFELPHRFTTYLLRPSVSLRARLRHTLKARVEGAPDSTRTWTFETGDGPVTAPPPSIGLGLVQAVDPVVRSSCGYDSFACVGLSHRGIVDVEVRRRCDGALVDHNLQRTDEGGLTLAYNGIAVRVPFCATLRARQANGALGPAATFCTTPAETSLLVGRCRVTCAGGSAWVDGRLLPPPPGDVAPDVCMAQSPYTPAQWAEAVRALREEVADASCLADDAHVADASVADAFVADEARDAAVPPVDAPAGAAGCRAAPARASSAGAWIVAFAAWRGRRRARRLRAERV